MDPAVWGDGFADDGWAEALAVTDWHQVSPDEHLRLFPRLVAGAGAGAPSAAVLARVAASMDVARRGSARGMKGLAALRDGPPLAAPVGDDTLAMLDGIVREGWAGHLPGFVETTAFALAFVARLHPAYLWPEAAASAGSLTAAGWIGVLATGRPALMPLEIAEILTDIVRSERPSAGCLRDPRFAICGLDDTQWSSLARYAARRLRGKRDTIRLRHRRAPVRLVPPSWPRLFRRPAQALSPWS